MKNLHLQQTDDYEEDRTIGHGSSEVVRLVMHLEARQKTAIKIIK